MLGKALIKCNRMPDGCQSRAKAMLSLWTNPAYLDFDGRGNRSAQRNLVVESSQ